MEVNDRIPSELTAPTALGATAVAVFTNAGANYRTQVTQMFLCNIGTNERKIAIYKNGLLNANKIASSITLSGGASVIIDDLKLVFTGSQVLGASQDVGTDINIAVYGIVEQIA